jgi:hypothetical protein
VDQPVLEEAAVDPAFAQPLKLAQAQLPVAPDDAPTVVAAQGREEIGGAAEAIAQDEGVPGEIGQGGFRARHLANRRIGAEVQVAAQPAPHVVDPEQAARQHHGAFVPQQLQPMGDGGQARPIEDHEGGEPLPHGHDLGSVPRRNRRHQAGGEAPEDLGEEGGPQIAAALEERFGARLDPRERRVPTFQRIDQGLTQRLRRPQDDRGPEADQRLERPYPLPLGPAHRAENRPTQRRRDVLLQQIHDPQQVDRLRALGHSSSR